jgi:hypothetical protein
MAILQSRYFRGHKARASLDASVIAIDGCMFVGGKVSVIIE